ncbi:hypothetical protein DOY81_006209 [Sarcophaga bullata]|nr:hypothetical protein DOY81_006209 [Sarcophaga bullata]
MATKQNKQKKKRKEGIKEKKIHINLLEEIFDYIKKTHMEKLNIHC